MTRSKWKDNFFTSQLLSKFEKTKKEGSILKIWARNSKIIEDFKGRNVLVHNGNLWVPVSITQEMIGHKLGEFANTRKPCTYKKNRKKK
jgi:small subunit ribosomal protein S19